MSPAFQPPRMATRSKIFRSSTSRLSAPVRNGEEQGTRWRVVQHHCRGAHVQIGVQNVAQLGPERHHTRRRRGFEPAESVGAEGHCVPLKRDVRYLEPKHFGAPPTGEQKRGEQRVHEVGAELAASPGKRPRRLQEERRVRHLEPVGLQPRAGWLFHHCGDGFHPGGTTSSSCARRNRLLKVLRWCLTVPALSVRPPWLFTWLRCALNARISETRMLSSSRSTPKKSTRRRRKPSASSSQRPSPCLPAFSPRGDERQSRQGSPVPGGREVRGPAGGAQVRGAGRWQAPAPRLGLLWRASLQRRPRAPADHRRQRSHGRRTKHGPHASTLGSAASSVSCAPHRVTTRWHRIVSRAASGGRKECSAGPTTQPPRRRARDRHGHLPARRRNYRGR